MWFCWKPKCWMFLIWSLKCKLWWSCLGFFCFFWSSRGGVRLPQALCPAREPRPLRHCWGIPGMLAPEVINLATQSLTSALSSHQSPLATSKQWQRSWGWCTYFYSTEIGAPVLTRLFYITIIYLSVWQHRRLKTSRGSSTSWLFLFYCGGKHLLNYRAELKRTLDLNPPQDRIGSQRARREGGWGKRSGDQYHVVRSVLEIIWRGFQLACCVSGMLALCNVTASTRTCHVSERSTNHFERPLEKCASVTL